MPVSRQASKIRWSLVRACARVCNSFGRRVRRELEGRLSSKFVHAPLGAGRGDPNRGARGHFASEIEAARSDDTRVTKGRCWRDPRTAFSPSFYSFSPPPPAPLSRFSIIERDTIRQFFQSNELGKIRLPRSFVSSSIDRENSIVREKKTASFFFDRWCHPVGN